jgi:hypothetical protein
VSKPGYLQEVYLAGHKSCHVPYLFMHILYTNEICWVLCLTQTKVSPLTFELCQTDVSCYKSPMSIRLWNWWYLSSCWPCSQSLGGQIVVSNDTCNYHKVGLGFSHCFGYGFDPKACTPAPHQTRLQLKGLDSTIFTDSCVATRKATKRLALKTTRRPRERRMTYMAT